MGLWSETEVVYRHQQYPRRLSNHPNSPSNMQFSVKISKSKNTRMYVINVHTYAGIRGKISWIRDCNTNTPVQGEK